MPGRRHLCSGKVDLGLRMEPVNYEETVCIFCWTDYNNKENIS